MPAADRSGDGAVRLARWTWAVAPAVALLTAAAVAAATTGAGGGTTPLGVVDAGPLTRWALPFSRTVADVAAVATVGALVLAAVLLPGPRRLAPAQGRAMLWASAAAGVWAVASVAVVVFTLSDLSARPAADVLEPAVLLDFVATDSRGTAHALTATTAALLATFGPGVTTAGWARFWLLAALAGLLPPAFTGHAAGSAGHDAAVVSLAVHLVGVTLWVGGLAFLLPVVARRHPDAAVAVRRFSVLAGAALVAVGAGGVVGAVIRLPGWDALFTSAYGRLVLVKTAVLVLLGLAGAWHRRRSLVAIATRTGAGAFVRLAAGELLLMAVAMGLAVGLARTPPPSSTAAALSPAGELLGFPMPPPLGGFPWTPLFTQWHFDPVFAFGTAAAGLAYAVGVRRLRARGDHWPVGRTVSWFLGLAVTVLATMSGLAVYGKVMFSVHMGQHMVLAMTVPILLVLGAPATLALRALPAAGRDAPPGPRELLLKLLHSTYVRVISHPAVAGVLFIGSAFAVYYTSLFEALMRSHLGHLVMLVHFLAVGLLFFWVIIGVDPGPRRPPHLGRLFVLMLTMPFHSWFSISLMSSTGLLAEGWWTSLARPWGPSLADDQYNAGAIAWATGDIPVLITTIILAVQWVRSDAREARRVDRRIDRGDAGDPLAAYNAYLAALHARDRRAVATRRAPAPPNEGPS
ncbi:cytochrome c oxidase assembly protein [Streptomyces hydrogenans]|uniref:cytochrome c oxidase assembly protein n=1 Tax=Streptomyces hydrogenans TaxID=1873719 RepID=UPI0035D93E4A